MTEYIDASVSIHSNLAAYGEDPPVEFEYVKAINMAEPYNLLQVKMTSHSGTHVDAPYHFFQSGKTVDQLPLDVLIGPARVVLVRGQESISQKFLEKVDLEGVRRVLFKTDHSYLRDRYTRFRSNYVHLEVDACGYLVGKGVKLVGIDSFSIEEFDSADHMAHKVLLGAGVVVVEMVNLKDVEPGEYEMFCIPLKIKKGDGAPTRVILKPVS